MKAINIPPHPVISNVKLQGNKKAYLIKPDNTIEEINTFAEQATAITKAIR